MRKEKTIKWIWQAIELSEIYDNELPFRVMDKPISLEDEFDNKTLSEIAKIEGRVIMSIKDSLDLTINNLEKKLKKFKKIKKNLKKFKI